MINFLAALYNEEDEIRDLIDALDPYVDHFYFCDDSSTDRTRQIIWQSKNIKKIHVKTIQHTGLPETVKATALDLIPFENEWVLMLDADERFADGVLEAITAFHNSSESKEIDYVYFRQVELIDGVPVREFQKCKLFRKRAMKFPLNNIHADDVLTGNGITREDWVVLHRKTTNKQVMREMEYLNTYKKLLSEGKIDEGRYQWLVGLHHYVRPH